ncbi:hypothetical protein C3489_26195 [Streptomyces sp. Ru71]|uniref:DUF6069 family protein n=1 Tax=Streptomyces sp. Ru71 TaxID=2080746 RepID=UPI000CDE3655|nr:DUF6069 family protein [Streptomyces sp. Ru71]POX48791.1 hypothetical protein C3489_26195 [Streptomyces sp. Ru71]
METSDPPQDAPRATDAAPVTARRRGPGLDAGRLWAGGVMAAGVAGLAAVAALLVVRGVLGVALFVPRGDDVMASASTGLPAGGAALAALAATGLVHVLALTVPRPGRLFTWLATAGTAAAALLPFTTTASTGTQLGTATVNLAIGATIGSLLSAVGRGAVRKGW